MCKVSLIIPVYNAREHITACLDSVLAQTLDEMEVILVDDRGSDDSIAIAHRHLAGYTGPKRFRFAEMSVNSGPGAARNYGIQQADGEYVAFLDSDDTLTPDFCQRLYEASRRADADLAFGSISFDHPDGTATVKHNPAVKDSAFTGAAKRRYLLRFTSYFTTGLYRRCLLQDDVILFPDTHSAEDSCFLICALLSARRIARDDQAVYHYTLHPTSISRRRDRSRWKNRLASFRSMVDFAREHDLYRPYHLTLRLLVFKKGYLMAAKDYLTNNLF